MDITSDADVLPGSFELAIKDNDGVVEYNYLFVIDGHRDKMKHLIVHAPQNIQLSTVRMMLSRQ